VPFGSNSRLSDRGWRQRLQRAANRPMYRPLTMRKTRV
jgi:hypothetical protein